MNSTPSTNRRVPVYKRFENLTNYRQQNNPTSTPINYKNTIKTEKSSFYKKTPARNCSTESSESIVNTSRGTTNSNLDTKSSATSNSETLQSDDYTYDYYDDSDISYVEEEDIKEIISAIDSKCKKQISGRDLIQIFFYFTKWFSNLKDSKADTSNGEERSRKYKKPVLTINKDTSKRTGNKIIGTKFDSPDLITGDLRKDVNLRLKYTPKGPLQPWDNSYINKYGKYKKIINCKMNFIDDLKNIPGIGEVYCDRLKPIIPNVGTLIDLFMNVDKMTFKALLYNYANINAHNLNLIYTSCKNYIKKYGFDFKDIIVKKETKKLPKPFVIKTPVKSVKI